MTSSLLRKPSQTCELSGAPMACLNHFSTIYLYPSLRPSENQGVTAIEIGDCLPGLIILGHQSYTSCIRSHRFRVGEYNSYMLPLVQGRSR
jgi:hypothetical protein